MKYTSSFIISALTLLTSVATASTPEDFDKCHEKLSQEIIQGLDSRITHSTNHINVDERAKNFRNFMITAQDKLIDKIEDQKNIFKKVIFDEIDINNNCRVDDAKSFIDDARNKIKNTLNIDNQDYDEIITVALYKNLENVRNKCQSSIADIKADIKKEIENFKNKNIDSQSAIDEIQNIENQLSTAIEQVKKLTKNTKQALKQKQKVFSVIKAKTEQNVQTEIQKVKNIHHAAQSIKAVDDITGIYNTLKAVDTEYGLDNKFFEDAKALKKKYEHANQVFEIYNNNNIESKDKFNQISNIVKHYTGKDDTRAISAVQKIVNSNPDNYEDAVLHIADLYKDKLGKDGARVVDTVKYLHQAAQLNIPSDLSQMSAQNVASAAPVFVGLVSSITGNRASKEVNAVTGLLVAYATGNPIAAISSISGLFGGGGGQPDPAIARHQAIMKQFEQVNIKLDELLEGQKEILAGQEKIRANIREATKKITERIDKAEKNIIKTIIQDNNITRMQLRDVYTHLYRSSYVGSIQNTCDLYLDDTLFRTSDMELLVPKWVSSGFVKPNFDDAYNYNKNFTKFTTQNQGFANCFEYFNQQRAALDTPNMEIKIIDTQSNNIENEFAEYSNIYLALLKLARHGENYYMREFVFPKANLTTSDIDIIQTNIDMSSSNNMQYKVVDAYNLMRLVGIGTTILKYAAYSNCNQGNLQDCKEDFSNEENLKSKKVFKSTKIFLNNLRKYLLYSYYQQAVLSGAPYINHTYYNDIDGELSLSDRKRTILWSNSTIAKNFFTKLCYFSEKDSCIKTLRSNKQDLTNSFTEKPLDQILGHNESNAVTYNKKAGLITVKYKKCQDEECTLEKQDEFVSFTAPTVDEVKNHIIHKKVIHRGQDHMESTASYFASDTMRNIEYTIKYLDGILNFFSKK